MDNDLEREHIKGGYAVETARIGARATILTAALSAVSSAVVTLIVTLIGVGVIGGGSGRSDDIDAIRKERDGLLIEKDALSEEKASLEERLSHYEMPEGVDVWEGHRYWVGRPGTMDWDQAEAFCEYLGGHLVTIGSGKEQEHLERLIRNAAPENFSFLWIGMRYDVMEAVWSWVDGMPVDEDTYQRWWVKSDDQRWPLSEGSDLFAHPAILFVSDPKYMINIDGYIDGYVGEDTFTIGTVHFGEWELHGVDEKMDWLICEWDYE